MQRSIGLGCNVFRTCDLSGSDGRGRYLWKHRSDSGRTERPDYLIEPSEWLPKFEKLEPVGTIYAKGLYIPPREFMEGFPGITDRVEWFAIGSSS